MKKHKFNIFPEMLPDDYARLVADLKANGYDQSQPIYTYEGDVLDGWNRLRACNELGITPTIKRFDGDEIDAIQFVMRTNKRRNLTSSQWAAIAVEAEEIVEALREAVERERRAKQSESLKQTHETGVSVNLLSQTTPERVTSKLAETFNTNRTYISDAAKLRNEKPEVFEQVKRGEKTMTEVKKEEKKERYEHKKNEFEKQITKSNTEQVIILGDCLEVLPTLEGAYDLLLTDPPYGMDFKSGWNAKERIRNDKVKDMMLLIDEALCKAGPLLKDDAHFYIFGNIDYIHIMRPIIEKYFVLKNILIWDRGVIGMGDLKTYGDSYDIIYFGVQYKWRDLNGVRDRDVLKFNRVAPAAMIHQTEKPIDLLEYLIKKSTNEGDAVLDPFAGGGSTLMAAKKTNRKCTGIELLEENYNLIKSRI